MEEILTVIVDGIFYSAWLFVAAVGLTLIYGVSKKVKGKMTVANVKRYPASAVNPPDGVKAADWIAGGFKK